MRRDGCGWSPRHCSCAVWSRALGAHDVRLVLLPDWPRAVVRRRALRSPAQARGGARENRTAPAGVTGTGLNPASVETSPRKHVVVPTRHGNTSHNPLEWLSGFYSHRDGGADDG